jgi:hypothetical protein
LIANREVEIRPRLGTDSAQLVDILVQVWPSRPDGASESPVTVVIEVKCAWNNGVLTDMSDQLFDRYLRNEPLNFGIYVTAYFNCPGWNKVGDSRKTANAHKQSIKGLSSALNKQATRISSLEKRITSRVLDARLDISIPIERGPKRRKQAAAGKMERAKRGPRVRKSNRPLC